jgi:hypothetical protein
MNELITIQRCIGKIISAVALAKCAIDQSCTKKYYRNSELEGLRIDFTDNTAIVLGDEGSSCCETRYMTTDDDLSYYVGATLLKVEIASAPSTPPNEYGGEHEIQFLRIITSKGVIVCETHNEHNGYYGGFNLEVYWVQGKA